MSLGRGSRHRQFPSPAATAVVSFGRDPRRILAVLADPANVTDLCGTHQDIPIASCYLNATVCGLMSRTILRPGMEKRGFHGVAFYEELRGEDRTYEFINKIESLMNFSARSREEKNFDPERLNGLEEAHRVAKAFGVEDLSPVKRVKDLELESFFFTGPEGYKFEVEHFTSPELQSIF
jgi:hypothetical protein